MVTINFVCVGNLKESFYKQAVSEYAKRLSRFCKINIIEVPEEQIKGKENEKTIEAVKEKEGVRILEKSSGYIILLDVLGKSLTSPDLAEKIEEITQTSSKITFIIGGSHGVSNQVKQAADFKFSFSKLTFPHQLMRVVLAEQVYRAFTINNNITYHK